MLAAYLHLCREASGANKWVGWFGIETPGKRMKSEKKKGKLKMMRIREGALFCSNRKKPRIPILGI